MSASVATRFDPAAFLADPIAPPAGVQSALIEKLVEQHAAQWPSLRAAAPD